MKISTTSYDGATLEFEGTGREFWDLFGPIRGSQILGLHSQEEINRSTTLAQDVARAYAVSNRAAVLQAEGY